MKVATILREGFKDPMKDLPCQLSRAEVSKFEEAGLIKFIGTNLAVGPIWQVVGQPRYTYKKFDTGAIRLVCSLQARTSLEDKVVDAAAAMFDGSGGGIGDLKRAVKEFEEKNYRIYKMMADAHVTYWPTLFKTPDDAARWAKEKDLTADLGLHEYLAVQDETTEEIVKYL